MTPGPREGLGRRLEAWFSEHARDLPWRGIDDPWAIWLSEVMLQQTRVETVRERFGPMLARFPSVDAMAASPLDDVLAAWSGLGYYRRARLLHAGARHVVERFGGRIPGDVEGLRSIPGVGTYTSRSIAAIAFRRPVAAIDGNASRVLARVGGVDAAVGSSRLNREATILGDALVAEGDPRAIAQAIFEVGALLCLPRVARCHPCPLRSGCASARSDDPCALPRPRARKPPTRWGGTVAVPVLPDGRVVLRRRSDDAGLLAGMWFPLAEVGAGLDPPDPVPIAARLAGTPPSRCEVRGRGRWRFTHVLLEPMVVRVQVDHAPDAPDLAARTPVAWADHALPSATRALLATAGISLAPARPHRENAAP